MHVSDRRYLVEWIFTLFAKALPLEPTAWIWDQILVLGDQLIFQCALGLLHLLEPNLLTMTDLSEVALVFKDLTASPVLFEALTAVNSREFGISATEPTMKKRDRWRPLYDCMRAQAVDCDLWASFLTRLSNFEASLGIVDSPKTLSMRLRLSNSGASAAEKHSTSPERNGTSVEEEAMEMARARGRRAAVTLEWEAPKTRSEVDIEEDKLATMPPALSVVAADARRQFSRRTSSAKALASTAVAAAANTSKAGAGGAGATASRLTGRLTGRLSEAKRGRTENSTAHAALQSQSAPESTTDAVAPCCTQLEGRDPDPSQKPSRGEGICATSDEHALVVVPEGLPPFRE
jgi:hypothetical protein